jgi:plastocyanin
MTTSTFESASGRAHREVNPSTIRWLPLQRTLIVVILVAFVAVQAISLREVSPIYVAIMAPFALALAATWRWPRGGSVALGVLGLLLLLAFLPDVVRDLSNPDSTVTFIVTGVVATAALASVFAGGAILLKRQAHATWHGVRIGAAVLVIGVFAVGIAARLTIDSHAIEPGDVSIVADRVRFGPDSITASAGDVAIHVNNRDWMPHDLTIDELGVKLQIPERSARRITFDTPAGTYEAYCSLPGHERMKLTLIVE